VVLSADQTETSSGTVVTPIAWTSASFDTDHLFDPAHNTRLTAPISGVYQIDAGVRWAANPTGLRFLAICLNGDTTGCFATTNIGASEVQAVSDSGHLTQQTASSLIELNAGDTVSAVVQQDSGGNLAANADPATFLSMTWVGKG
jgi:hypothetical protein